MMKRTHWLALGSLISVPLALAQADPQDQLARIEYLPNGQEMIWLPGAAAPVDIHGNRAIPSSLRFDPAQHNDHGDHGLRGLPNWAPFGPSGADAESVAGSPTAAGVVIAGISNAFGAGAIFRSTNGGNSWSAATGTGNTGIKAVAFASNGTAWAAARNGVYRSTDSGATWSLVTFPQVSPPPLGQSVAIDPGNPDVVWIGLDQYGNTSYPTLYRTTDGGATWQDLTPPVSSTSLGLSAMAMDPANPQRIYAAFTGSFGIGGELWVTTNGGASWDNRSAGLPGNIINDIAFSGATAYVAGGQDFGSLFLGLYSTTNDGLSWTEHSAAWPSRSARAVAIDPGNPNHILVGTTRAGVVRTTDGGASWTFSSGGTGTYQVNDVAFSPTAPSTIFLGMGSVAVWRSTNGGDTFSSSATGISRLELTSFAINPLDNNEIAVSYVGLNDGGIFTSIDGGATWQLSQAPLPRWQKLYFAPNGILYASHDGPLGRADDGLWRRAPGSGTWTNLGPGSPSALDNIGLEIVATPGPDPVILWGGYRWLNNFGAQVWSYNRIAPNTWEREFEGAFSFEQVNTMQWLNGGVGPRALAGIVDFGGQGAGRILRSTDLGDTWAASEAGYIPGWHAWKMIPHPTDGNTIYLSATLSTGSANGSIFKTTDGGQNWQQMGTTPASRVLAEDRAIPGTLFIGPTWTNTGPQRSEDEGATFSLFNTGFLPSVAIRDLVYGGTVNGARRLYAATSGGGAATNLPGGPPACPADWDDNGVVNSQDISAFITDWLASVNLGTLDADFNGDGQVNSTDISAFITAWLDAVVNGC